MTKIELQDNLVFLSALKLLEQLTEKGLLTVDEAEKSRIELERISEKEIEAFLL